MDPDFAICPKCLEQFDVPKDGTKLWGRVVRCTHCRVRWVVSLEESPLDHAMEIVLADVKSNG
jgi:predicted Zn finger-like uncharacterized protein